jgi:hypothetical protein
VGLAEEGQMVIPAVAIAPIFAGSRRYSRRVAEDRADYGRSSPRYPRLIMPTTVMGGRRLPGDPARSRPRAGK